MNHTQKKTFKNATGKIDYTMTNDYMFRAVLQENEKVLTELICSLLHLNRDDVRSVVILNPIELGKSIDDRGYVLDIKVMLNNALIINIEMQILHQIFWNDRSLLYLCKAFDNLGKGDDYTKIKPAYHIGILDFTPFPRYPEFYARACLKNAFCQMCVTVCGRFVPNEGRIGVKGIKSNALCNLNLVQISRKVGRAAGGNDFSNTP